MVIVIKLVVGHSVASAVPVYAPQMIVLRMVVMVAGNLNGCW